MCFRARVFACVPFAMCCCLLELLCFVFFFLLCYGVCVLFDWIVCAFCVCVDMSTYVVLCVFVRVAVCFLLFCVSLV